MTRLTWILLTLDVGLDLDCLRVWGEKLAVELFKGFCTYLPITSCTGDTCFGVFNRRNIYRNVL